MNGHLIAEIDADAIRANIKAIRRRIDPATRCCAVVKANAYGHGIENLLPLLTEAGITRLAVAQMIEAIELRELGWAGQILCLGNPLAQSQWRDARKSASQAIAYGIDCTICDITEAKLLNEQATARKRPARVHVKIDTGMGRMGVPAARTAALLAEIAACPGLRLNGVYTHFATADEPDDTFAELQLEQFRTVLDHMDRTGISVKDRHASNSAAVFRLPQAQFNMVRPGLALYGYWTGNPTERPKDLRPCLRLLSEIVAVRQLSAGHSIGYGRTFNTDRDTIVGVVPIGYADGYRRSLSNNATMTLERGSDHSRINVPVLGRVSMDMTTVDLTEAGAINVGDRIIVIDSNPAAANSVESIARELDTIPYEITCLLGNRIKRQLVGFKTTTKPKLPAPQLKEIDLRTLGIKNRSKEANS